MISCASVVTKKCLLEFELLDFSISQHHKVEWFLSTDQETANYLGGSYNCEVLIDDERGTHGVKDSELNNKHMKMMMTKFEACRSALKNYDSVLFMDCDIFFLNPLSEDVISLMNNPSIDALLCPHHSENKSNEAKVGYYNAGFFIIRSQKLLDDWEKMSMQYKKLGMYYEQQPLEYASKTYITINLPMQYDIGWWRMNETNTKFRINKLALDKDGVICFFGSPAISIHSHTFRKLAYANYGTIMLLRLVELLASSNNQKHQALYKKFCEICRSWQ